MTLHIRNFERFQHRDVIRSGKAMDWIKDYTGQLSDDEWVSLTYAQRGLLESMRLEYARSIKKGDEHTPSTPRGLPEDTVKLTRRLGQRVVKRDLETLISRGFVEVKETREHHAGSTRGPREENAANTDTATDQHEQSKKTLALVENEPAGGQQAASVEERRLEEERLDVTHPSVDGWSGPGDHADNVASLLERRRAMR